MRVSTAWLGAGVVAAFLVGGGCGSTPGKDPDSRPAGCPPVETWEKLNGKACDAESISCSESGECTDDEHFTASLSLYCDGGTWHSGHSDDECCPFEDYASEVGEDCSFVGEGVSCHADPEPTCGVDAIICTDGVWAIEGAVAGMACAGAGGESGAGGAGGVSGMTSGGASPDFTGGVGGAG